MTKVVIHPKKGGTRNNNSSSNSNNNNSRMVDWRMLQGIRKFLQTAQSRAEQQSRFNEIIRRASVPSPIRSALEAWVLSLNYSKPKIPTSSRVDILLEQIAKDVGLLPVPNVNISKGSNNNNNNGFKERLSKLRNKLNNN